MDLGQDMIIFKRCRTTPTGRVHRCAAPLKLGAGRTIENDDIAVGETLLQFGIGHQMILKKGYAPSGRSIAREMMWR